MGLSRSDTEQSVKGPSVEAQAVDNGQKLLSGEPRDPLNTLVSAALFATTSNSSIFLRILSDMDGSLVPESVFRMSDAIFSCVFRLLFDNVAPGS